MNSIIGICNESILIFVVSDLTPKNQIPSFLTEMRGFGDKCPLFLLFSFRLRFSKVSSHDNRDIFITQRLLHGRINFSRS